MYDEKAGSGSAQVKCYLIGAGLRVENKPGCIVILTKLKGTKENQNFEPWCL